MAVFEKKGLARLTFPLFLYAFLSVGVSFVDQMLLSAYSEGLAAAVSVANQILGVAYDLSGLLAVGALIVVSQSLGRDDIAGAQRVASIAILGNTLFSGLVAVVLFMGGDYFIAWVNTPPEIRAEAKIYLYVIAFAILFNGFIVAATSTLRAFGHTWVILVLGLLANFLYLGLEYALIFGNWGFPELGVWGAALSTLIVRLLSVVFLLWLLARVLRLRIPRSLKRLRFGEAPVKLRAPIRLVGRLTRLSAPSVCDNILYNLYQLAIVSFVAILGTASILTRSYSLTVTALVSIIARVISQGNEVLVGYDQGAEAYAAARRRALLNALRTAAAISVVSAVLWWHSDALIGLFTEDAEILSGARTVLFVGIILHPCQTAGLILFHSLKVVGDVYWPVAYSLGVTFLFSLPLAWLTLTQLRWGVPGLWLIHTLEEFLKALIMYVRWRRMGWVRYRVPPQTVEVG